MAVPLRDCSKTPAAWRRKPWRERVADRFWGVTDAIRRLFEEIFSPLRRSK